MYELLVAGLRDKNEESLQQIRKAGFVPGILYGKELDSIPVKFQAADLLRVLSKNVQIFEVKVENGKKHLVSVENIQRDILKGNILHLSLQTLNKSTKTVAKISLVLVEDPSNSEGRASLVVDTINVKGLPKDIPAQISISVPQLQPGDSLKASDLKMPLGVKLIDDPESVIVKYEEII